MANMNKKFPDCFGDLEVVFPKGENDLRSSPESSGILPCVFT
jgi:hypothetical protein